MSPVRQTCADGGCVQELFVVVALLGSLGGLALGLHVVPVETLLLGGIWLATLGFGVGIPASALYHALLWRSLRRAQALPAGWYWRPTSLHRRVPAAERPWVLAFCALGAAGFFAIVLGCAALALAVWRSR